MLRIIAKIVKPKSAKGHAYALRMWIYRRCVDILRHYYAFYAYSDTVVIDNSRIRIVCECRDLDFERILQETNIDVRPHLTANMPLPTPRKQKSWHPFYKCFHFHRTLNVFINDEEICIDRTEGITIESTAKGVLRLSDSSDIFTRSSFLQFAKDEVHEKKTNAGIKKHQMSQSQTEGVKNIAGVEVDESF